MYVYFMEIFYLIYNVFIFGIVVFIVDCGCLFLFVFQYMFEDFRDDYFLNLNVEEGGFFRSEFSVILEWQYILVVVNVVGRSICDLFGNNFEFEIMCEVLNVFDCDLNFVFGNFCVYLYVVRKFCWIWFMEFICVVYIYDCFVSGELKNLLLDDDKYMVLSDLINFELR